MKGAVLGVVRRNPEFRRLWLAQVVSEAGDWLNRIAILSLIGRLSGESSTAQIGGLGALFGLELATRMLPTAVMGPFAGPIADRLSRRALMIGADVVRAGIVLAILTIDEPSELPLLFVLLALQMSVSIFFQSARSSAVPSTVPQADLHEAYTLSAVTWSAMLSVGALLGSLLLGWVGIRGVIVVDALTYLISAGLLLRLRLWERPKHPDAFRLLDVLLLTEMRRAFAHVRDRALLPAVCAKGFWGGAGGFLVLLSLTANERFASADASEMPAPESAALAGTAVGLLYFARGVGTGIGPVLARRFHGSSDAALRRQIAAGFGIGALGYLLFSGCHSLVLAIVCVVFAHMGGSALWVASTLAWQRHVEDRYRGRVYALEFLLMTLSFSAAGYATGLLYDATESLLVTIWTVVLGVVVSGAAWTWLAVRTRRRSRAEAGAGAE